MSEIREGRLAPAPGQMRLKLVVRGAVQGVGFRPFIHRLAMEQRLAGWVRNSAQGVFIEVEGPRGGLERFLLRIEAEKPPRSFIQSLESSWLDPVGYASFEIRPSEAGGDKTALVLPDIATCPDCLREVLDPDNRRYRYPFTNCTHCGPRFSIIEALPYDRANTSMKGFTMCPPCQAEYDDPRDRRFHAQPNACPLCGPHLAVWNNTGKLLASRAEALLSATTAVRQGQIVAVKGLGGFHLLVAAHDEQAVCRLRALKHREEKPLALMFPSLDSVKLHCEVSALEERLLRSPEAPIVLLRRNHSALRTPHSALASSVAPNNPYLGAMLPYTPLHHLLLAEIGAPVVATSGNLSDEPICTDEREAVERLGSIADVLLVHDRPIVRHVDDSIVRVMMGRELVLRRARGYAPLPVTLKTAAPPILAVGAHLKNTIALSVGPQVFISQHIGDLETDQAFEAFRRVIGDFERLYETRPATVAADAHPDYLSTQFAQGSSLPVVSVQHHLAHVFSCMAENELEPPVLGVSWDGTGYGLDGTIWGGEFFQVTATSFQRVGHFRTFRLPGGDQAVKEPRRTALGLLFELFGDELFTMNDLSVNRSIPSPVPSPPIGERVPEGRVRGNAGSLSQCAVEEPWKLPTVRAFSATELGTLRTMLAKGLNAPRTSSAGRLFDAVASLTALRQQVRYEGQAAMELEFAANGIETVEAYEMRIQPLHEPHPLTPSLSPSRGEGARRAGEGDSAVFRVSTHSSRIVEASPDPEINSALRTPPSAFVVDWGPTMAAILEDLSQHTAVGVIAAKFHNALAEAVVAVARRVGESRVLLTGGCFQNRRLTERAVQRLREEGFRPYWHQRVPPNDGGIALGQIVAALRRNG